MVMVGGDAQLKRRLRDLCLEMMKVGPPVHQISYC